MLKQEIDKYKIKEISKNLDIPIANIYRWINDQPTISQINFIRLLNYLDISIQEYLEYYDSLNKK